MADKDDKNPEQDNLLREIDEELRQENLSKLWSKYGNAIIGAAVLLVVSVAGYKGWQTYDQGQRAEAASQLLAANANAEDGKTDDARVVLAKIGTDAPGGYAALARFRAAALLAEKGDKAGAATQYKALADDSGLDTTYRDLAAILGALAEVDTADPAQLSQRMAPLSADDNPWRHSAREISALAALRAGDKARARTLFDGLAEDSAAPQGLRSRARALALHLKD